MQPPWQGRSRPHTGARQRLVCHASLDEGSASSGSDDAPYSSRGDGSSSVPDTLPVASGSSDWRSFRAALLAAERGETAAAAEVQQSGWAHILPQAEQGCLLLAHPLFFHQNQTYFR